jgi:hypothetical protein
MKRLSKNAQQVKDKNKKSEVRKNNESLRRQGQAARSTIGTSEHHRPQTGYKVNTRTSKKNHSLSYDRREHHG